MGLSHTVSGNIASFRTPSRVPIESLKFHFLPKQEGSGDPSPTNVCPITGWTGLNGRRAGKNLFNYNKNNFALEDCINSSGNTINRQVYHTGFKNGVFTLSAHIKEGYSRPSYSLVNIGICENDINAITQSFIGSTESDKTITLNSNQELVLISTSDSLYSADNSFNKYDIQIEIGSNATDYKPYSGELIPITFPDGEIIYGGYIDPAAGEIVAEYAIEGPNSGTWTIGSSRSYQWSHTKGRDAQGHYKKNICTHWINNKHNYYSQESVVNVNENGALCIGKDYFVAAGFDYDNLTSSQITEYLEQLENNGTPFRVCYPLLNPIHIPVAPQDLKAFLDHNNFWSDTNGITEVTYAVTESKDILATRKKTMDFDMGHHKKVKWNQHCYPLTSEYWAVYSDTAINATFNDGIATSVWLDEKIGYLASVRMNYNIAPLQTVGDILYGSYMLNPSKNGLKWGMEMGNVQPNDDILKPANEWSRVVCIVTVTRSRNNTMYISDVKTTNGAEIGMTAQVKAPILINLTQMFGAGNEPTKAEFERICELNGIDLTTYQPYDIGSDRWLIIP